MTPRANPILGHLHDGVRPARWRRAEAWQECDVQPCGQPGELQFHYSRYDWKDIRPDLSDCLAVSPAGKPWLLTIWEPLLTKAPGPNLARPHCCYINTVIFYHSPHIVLPWKHHWRARDGKVHSSSRGFFEFDQIETRLAGDDRVIWRGDIFGKGGGRVMWGKVAGDPRGRRWWMRHGLRRETKELP